CGSRLVFSVSKRYASSRPISTCDRSFQSMSRPATGASCSNEIASSAASCPAAFSPPRTASPNDFSVASRVSPSDTSSTRGSAPSSCTSSVEPAFAGRSPERIIRASRPPCAASRALPPPVSSLPASTGTSAQPARMRSGAEVLVLNCIALSVLSFPVDYTRHATVLFKKSLRRDLVNLAGIVFATLFVIMLTTSLIRFLGRAAGGRVDTGSVLPLIAFNAINVLPVLLVLTLYIAVLSALTRAYRDSEMVVWFASGQSLLAWIRPVLGFAAPF